MSFFEPPVRERLNPCSSGRERNRHFFRYFNVRRFRGKSDEVAVVLNRQGVIGDRKRRILLDCLPEFTGGHGLYLRSATDRSEPRGQVLDQTRPGEFSSKFRSSGTACELPSSQRSRRLFVWADLPDDQENR
jgi:hypothetical protein